MRVRWTINLFLLILVSGLGWAVLRDVREAGETSRLTGMDPPSIEGVELTRPGRDTISLERVTGGGWRMTAPYRIAADPERVGRLLAVVRAGVVRSMPADGLDLERLGLEPNPVRISLGGQTLRFGGTEPIDGLRYVGAGDLVHLIEDRFHHLLTAAASDYVDPHPLPAGLVPVSGDIAGTAIAPPTLAAIAAVKAERVEPMGGELAGQILRIQPVGEGAALRFLVSADGLRWSRPDLRLTYLVASPPPALVDQGAAGPAESPVQVAAPTHTQDSGALPEQAVGVVQGVAPVLTDGQPAPAGGEAVPGQGEAAVAGAVDAGEPGGEQWAEPIVDPNAPMEIRVERLAPTDGALRGQNPGLDPLEARQREIDDAVSASFGGPPVRSQAQIQREEEGIVDGDAIVSPEEAAGPPPQVKLRPE